MSTVQDGHGNRFFITNSTAEQLKQREEYYAEVTLMRYFSALCIARKELVPLFSQEEISLMVDSLNGIIISSAEVMLTPFMIKDSINLEHLDKKWQVDGNELIRKLNNLDYIHMAALVDAIECWWGKIAKNNPCEVKDLLTSLENPILYIPVYE